MEVILVTIVWYRNQGEILSKFVSKRSGQDKSQSWFKVALALLYKRMSNERKKGNPPTPNNLSLYTLRLPPSNHSSCSDVPSEYPTMILQTTNTTLINTIMPQHPTSQHLNPLPYHNKLHHHHLPAPSPCLLTFPPLRNTNSFRITKYYS